MQYGQAELNRYTSVGAMTTATTIQGTFTAPYDCLAVVQIVVSAQVVALQALVSDGSNEDTLKIADTVDGVLKDFEVYMKGGDTLKVQGVFASGSPVCDFLTVAFHDIRGSV